MKVLHIITGLDAGGAEQQLRLLLRHLPPEYDCDVVALTNPGAVAAGLRADGVRVAELGMRGNRDLAALPALVRLIRRGRYDLVHCHLYRACVYGRIAARLAGVRAVVATEHSLLDDVIEGRPITPGIRALYLATERLGRCTVAVSQAVADRLVDWGVPAHRVRVIPNGVEVRRYQQPAPVRAATRQAVRAELGLPQDAFVVGGVGRLVPGKRFDVLIDALGQMGPAWLLLVGDGSARAELEWQARAAGLADRVVLTGERADVPELLTAMDVLAAPSTGETFGLSLLEALAAGLPVRWSSGPALAELPAGAAPGARLTIAQPGYYAAELETLRTGRSAVSRVLAQPEAVRHYDTARLALGVAELYRQTGRRPVPSLSAPEENHARR